MNATTMTKIEQLYSIFWDMYKDAHGVRPRGINTDSWTESQFNKEIDALEIVIRDNEGLRREDEAAAILKFEDSVTKRMHTGTNRERVIAWLMDAESAGGDFEYFCYLNGLPYGYFNRYTQ